jgi:hypothetical protein
MEPGADRPYFSHTPPTNYQRQPGAKVYYFVLEVPDEFVQVDGKIVATTVGEVSRG